MDEVRRRFPVTRYVQLLAMAAVISCSVVTTFAASLEPYPGHQEALAPLPPPPVLDPSKISLGRRLFHDPVLSGQNAMSCSTCHNLQTGGTIRLSRTVGYQGKVHQFNAPTIFNVGNNYRLGWRGRFTSLPVQNETILHDPNLMAIEWPDLLSRLNGQKSYIEVFAAQYGRQADRENVLDALVAYQLSLVTPDSSFDQYLEGNQQALSPIQKQGLKLFMEYGCVSCHQGSNIGGNMFQIFGVFGDPDARSLHEPEDLEKRLQRHDKEENVFRVPSLRNVEVTAPYFHDGRTETLREAIAIMGESQLGRQLNDEDIAALEAFLKSLTGVYNGKRLSTAVTDESR
ncbi:cytochrome-c peroxidase [Agrobacterium sp. Azo12]|uniref:cytochrome-c peroxidase n=1 Tax=Agrobacterium sp. Azo12 TaxID=3031129 RepID=UPI0023D8177A|nr:cytochrome c peroxidase [Agrobacterium sp. Azo12]MDO5898356.1 cytochrome c peroxidase [Agrobacterium sp. Azo12]